MANYSFTSNARFRPFSYAEMLQPLQAYTNEYNTIEGEIGQLGEQADVFKSLANEQTDPIAYAQYRKYADDLTAQAEDLAKQGLTPTSRKSLIGMKRRYRSEITPIEEAYKRRAADIEAQKKGGSGMIYSRRASTTSLDDYLKDNALSYESYSGKDILAQTAQAASNLQRELRNYTITGTPDPYTNAFLKQYGLSASEVLQAINNPSDPNSSKVLSAITNSVLESTGIPTWGNQEALNQAMGYVNQGLFSAIGRDEVAPIEDYMARMTAKGAGASPQTKGIAVNYINRFSQKEKEEAHDNLNKFSKYFYKDEYGRTKVNQDGMRELKKEYFNPGNRGYAGSEDYYKPVSSEFRRFLNSIGADKLSENDLKPGNLGRLFEQYEKQNKSAKYDAYKDTEVEYRYTKDEQEPMKKAIVTFSEGLPLRGVDYGKGGKSIELNNDELDLRDLLKDDYSVYSTRLTELGTTVMIQDKKEGKTKRYLLPSINPLQETNRDNEMKKAKFYQDAAVNGQYKDGDGNIVKIDTPEKLAEVWNKYHEAVQSAVFYQSQLGLSNKLEDQKFTPVAQ